MRGSAPSNEFLHHIYVMDISLLVNPDDDGHLHTTSCDRPTIRRRSLSRENPHKVRKVSIDSDSDSFHQGLPMSLPRNLPSLPLNLASSLGLSSSSSLPLSLLSLLSLSLSRRNTVTSITSLSSHDEESPPPFKVPTSYEAFIEALRTNRRYPLHLDKVSFTDHTISSHDRDDIVKALHDKYVQPLLAITGYKWVRKDGPGKKQGVKTFTIKYVCSQQKPPRPNGRCRQLSHPLKEFNCDSCYCIKYHQSSATIDIAYHHHCHLPYKFLPEKVKTYISERLDMRAQDIYHEILNHPNFSDVNHLIYFTKVQSYWSKERIKKRDETTKQAFKRFLEN